jgi:hypothetical protein
MNRARTLRTVPLREAKVNFEDYLPQGCVDDALNALGSENVPADFDRKSFSRDLAEAYLWYRGRARSKMVPTAATSRRMIKNLAAKLGNLLRALPDPESLEDPWQWSFDHLAEEHAPIFEAAKAELDMLIQRLTAEAEADEISAGDGEPSRLRWDLFQAKRRTDVLTGIPYKSPQMFFIELSARLYLLAEWIKLYQLRDAQFQAGKLTSGHWKNLFANKRGNLDIGSERSLVRDLIPAIYESHFRRELAVSRDAETGQLRGPALRFAQAVLHRFEVTSARTKRPLSDEGIAFAWRTRGGE